jgi:microsomal dipeptidase-like Zn-dependent dipeptidase
MHDRSRTFHDAAIIIDALLSRGYTESEAGKILAENMVRLFGSFSPKRRAGVKS